MIGRSFMRAKIPLSSARAFSFFFPRRFEGIGPVEKYTPQKDEYLRVQKQFKAGDKAPLAYPNIKYFPSWYKPHSMNYHSYGYQITFVALIVIANLIVNYEYAKRKGRDKMRKVVNPFKRERFNRPPTFVEERLKAGDPEWTKFLHKPPE